MKPCDKRDVTWLTAMMLDADIFGGCSEDGTEKKRMVSYVTNLVSRPDIVVLPVIPGQMIISFVRKTGVMWEVHAAIRRTCMATGKERVQLARGACTWMAHHKGARKFTASIPVVNRAAMIYAARVGLKRVGILTSAMMKNGKLIDLALYQSDDEDMKSIIRGA